MHEPTVNRVIAASREGVEILDGIEIPPARRGPPFKYPWRELKPGQSFIYRGPLTKALAACHKYGKQFQKDFIARTCCTSCHQGRDTCACPERQLAVRIWRAA